MANDEVKVASKLQNIPLADLHIQYVHNVTPIDLWRRDMSLATSPHVELLRLIRGHGLNWDILKDTRYVEERRHRRAIGMKQWTDEYIKRHIKTRWDTYRSLKKHGFDAERYKKKDGRERPVLILAEPFWRTRFGYDAPWLCGPEIWDGGGRCSAAYVLGWKTIPAKMAADRKPGTGDKGRFAEKLAPIKGVWNFGKTLDTQDN